MTFRRTLFTWPKETACRPLVQHANAVLFALNGFANDVGHAFRTDRQLLLARGQLFGQTAQLNFHLFDGLDRIVGADDVLTDALAQVLVHRDIELNLTLRPLRIFRQAQHIAQVFVIRHGQTQRTERLIRHRAQLVAIHIRQLAAVQAAFHAVVFHQAHHRAPARLGGHHLLTQLMIIAFQLAQFLLQAVHFGFAEGQLLLQLVAASAVVAQRRMQFVATRTGARFGIGVGLHADVHQLLAQLFQHVALGVVRAFQRGQHRCTG